MAITRSSTIPQTRGKAAQLFTAVAAILFFLLGIGLSEADILYTIGINITVYPIIIMLTEILRRFCLISEEVCHIQSRYGNVIKILQHAFTFSKAFLCVFVLLLFPLFYISLKFGFPLKLVYELGYSSGYCLIGALLFCTLLNLEAGPLYVALTISGLNGLDYGSSMAHSFFHGYLQIMLPDRGAEKKGIKEMINDFAAKEGIKFSCSKLIVLIPLSLHCPPNAAQYGDLLELAKSLPEITLNRAGVKQRSYKNTAYSIKVSDKEKEYVCLEYATPLQTLFEVVNHRSDHSNHYAIQQKELALQFYLTLQKLIKEDPSCKDCCDLIFFDDKTEDGEYKDVGEVVLEHIKKYRQRSYNLRSLGAQNEENNVLIENVET